MKKLPELLRTKSRIHPLTLVAILACLLFITAGSIVSINRFWQFDVFYYDFGIFDHATWEVSRLSPPIIEHISVPGKWIFADHFHPSIFLLSPLYWITDRSEMLLFIQATAAGLAGLVIFFTGLEILKNRYFSLIIMLSYYLFIGMQNAIITDFHEVTVATLPLALCFYFIVKKRLRPFIAAFLITLGCKESMTLLGLTLAVTMYFIQPQWRKIAVFTALISIIWGFLAVKIIIPYFSGGSYGYSDTIALNPITIIQSFLNNPIKIHTLFYSFLSFGFLPLFSPAFWLLIFQDFYTRFMTLSNPARFGFTFHYSALLSVIMGISSIYGLKFIKKLLPHRAIILLMTMSLLINIFLYRVTFHGPLALAYNPDFYRHSGEFGYLEKLVDQIPPETSVMTQNNLLVRFTHHKDIWLLRENYKDYKPDYIILDLNPGQNSNNFFGPIKNIESFFTNLKSDLQYKIIFNTKFQYIFKRL
jgi:uncharacterized membrane protein